MSINKVEEMVETYLNGNISDFKKWLKGGATKVDVVDTIIHLASFYGVDTDGYRYIESAGIIRNYLKS